MDKRKISVKAKAKAAISPDSEWKICDFDELPDFQVIYHISDIHIRPLQRHEEFRQVFEHLDTYLQSATGQNAVAVITGDVFDNKTVFRPETFKLCRDMLKMIAGHMPLIIIAGNHDMMENNTNRLDAITPVVDDIPNLYYLKYSGLYFCPNSQVCLTVSSLYDKAFIHYGDIKESKHYRKQYQYIALYHGTLTGAQTDTGYVAADGAGTDPITGSGTGLEMDLDKGASASASASTRYRSLSDFDGYNAVLLGDIHKHQIMRPVPPVAYAGSLIQQNHGENLDGHGVLVWQRQPAGSWLCQLQNIQNQYGFVDIFCQDGKWINKDAQLPSYCYARLIIKNCTETQIDVIVVELKEMTESLNITKRQCISDTLDDFEIPPDIVRKEDEITVIREQAAAAGYDADSLIQLHQEYQKELDVEAVGMSTAIWRPVTLEFKNMFGYGDGITNKMIFKRGTISISANNACGKTSIVNIILFAIFGRTPLNPSSTSYTYDIINNRENSGYVKILLNHGGQYYLIERKTIRKNTKSAASSVLKKLNRYDFSCNISKSNMKGERLQNCSEIRRNNNDTFIQELFGDINDFSLSNLLNKESSLDLLSMAPAEQIKVLKRLFKLEIYDTYKELNKTKLQAIEKEITSVNIERKTLLPLVDDSITEELLSAHESKIKAESGKLKDLREQFYALNTERNEFTAAIHGYRSEIKHIKIDDLPVDRAKHQLQLDGYLQASTPKDIGIPTKALQYKLEDLQRQIDIVEGTIDTLSLIPDRDILNNELKALETRKALEARPAGGSVNEAFDTLTESQLNRKLGDCNSKIGTLGLQIEELKSQTRDQLPPNTDLVTLRSGLHYLSTSLDAIGERLDHITGLFGGEVQESTIEGETLKLKITGIGSDISRLESENRQLDAKRDRTYVSSTEDKKQFQDQLYPNVPIYKFAVTEGESKSLQEQLVNLQSQMDGLCSGISFKELLKQLNHDNHVHDDDYDHYGFCILSHDMVDDIVAYLNNGDQIRKLDMQINRTQSSADKAQEQLELNRQIDYNNDLSKKIAQITYLENTMEIAQLRKELEDHKLQLNKHQLVQEYSQLCAEEERHYNNQEIQLQIDYLEAITKLDKLTKEISELDNCRSQIENRIYLLEIEKDIGLVRLNLDAHQRLDGLRKELALLKTNITDTEKQLAEQELFDQYAALQERDSRLQIHDYNLELEQCIVDVRSDLDVIESEITSIEQEITEHDNCVKELKEQLSVLNYRYREQENIKERLDKTEQRLIQLEKDIIPYQEYNSIMGNKGITSKLLFNKIKAIEDYINTITQQFTKYKIWIVYDDVKQTINMITENKTDGNYLSTSRLCGFEKLMLQIAFKRALNKFSYNSKSSLIIVDEAFDCIDQENFLTKLPDALNLITQDYSNCLAISQRDISHISDSILTIKPTGQNECYRLFQ
jgi:DNA repair exonuclease SbcCD ATPase subunit